MVVVDAGEGVRLVHGVDLVGTDDRVLVGVGHLHEAEVRDARSGVLTGLGVTVAGFGVGRDDFHGEYEVLRFEAVLVEAGG
ncbi:hypothetical protein QFZ49_004825 [Streptomyces turgidiscabies]|uniref:Uncharacterized protein n=1 Tax=Streptomyces turgidiscabies TaxID=85558 RepID=A0ABU0RSB2_9ACTN|nr:hypothetical protein [Streptomyces turgidiscabies]